MFMLKLTPLALCLVLGALIVLPTGCIPKQKAQVTKSPAPPVDSQVDSSCSYFYFLWGNSAEYKRSYEEALEAYEKATICDPKAEYIAEKIPTLLIRLGRLQEAEAWLENYIQDKPEKTVQRFMLARLKIQDGKEDEAIKLFQEALDLDPDNTSIKLRLGMLHAKEGDNEVAEHIFQNILNDTPNSYFATLYLARLYAKTGKLDDAEHYYKKALDLNWSNDLAYEIADFYNLSKQYSKAQETFQEILNKDEQDEKAALGMVQTYIFLKDREAALQELTRIKGFSSNPDRIDLVRSQILINMDDNATAKKILQNLLDRTSLSEARYLLGVIFYEELEFDQALKVVREIPPDAAEFKQSIILQIRILEETNRSAEAIALLDEILADKETRHPSFYSLLAAIHQNRGSSEQALNTLAEGVETYPEDESLLYEYAIAHERAGNHAKAMKIMKKLLSLNLNHADALNFIGYSWADRNIKLDLAYDYIRKALELKPRSGYIQDSLGWVYYRMGAFAKARTALEKAVELDPEDPYIHEHLGDTYHALKMKDKALSHYEKALQLHNDSAKIKALQEKINALSAD